MRIDLLHLFRTLRRHGQLEPADDCCLACDGGDGPIRQPGMVPTHSGLALDRFAARRPDPAECSPILRSTKRFTLPGLNKAESLPDLVDSSERRFLNTQLAREVNRARTAVREAIHVLDAS